MEVYSDGVVYDSWDDFYEAEANGFSVTVLMSEVTRKGDKMIPFARVFGPYPSKADATRRASSLRAKFKRSLREYPRTELLSVRVEPIFKDGKYTERTTENGH